MGIPEILGFPMGQPEKRVGCVLGFAPATPQRLKRA